jgi:hypothetical protein
MWHQEMPSLCISDHVQTLDYMIAFSRHSDPMSRKYYHHFTEEENESQEWVVSQARWLTPVILATQEAEIGRIEGK